MLRKKFLSGKGIERISCGGNRWHPENALGEHGCTSDIKLTMTLSACSRATQSPSPHASFFLRFPISPSFFPSCLPPSPLRSRSPAPTTSFPFYFLPPFPPHDLLSLSGLLPSSSCLCSSHLSSFSSFFSSRNLALIMEGSGAAELI